MHFALILLLIINTNYPATMPATMPATGVVTLNELNIDTTYLLTTADNKTIQMYHGNGYKPCFIATRPLMRVVCGYVTNGTVLANLTELGNTNTLLQVNITFNYPTIYTVGDIDRSNVDEYVFWIMLISTVFIFYKKVE